MGIESVRKTFGSGVSETIGLEQFTSDQITQLTQHGIEMINLQGNLTVLRNAAATAAKTAKEVSSEIKGLV